MALARGAIIAVNIGGVGIDLPLIIAFLILAAYTYTSGLRAPAMIALVKDAMIFIVLFVTIIYIPIKLGGFGNIFSAASHKAATVKTFHEFLDPNTQYGAYVTLALGSALALFLYPHSLTGVLSSNSQKVVKRNTALLPIYSLMLGLLALLGYMAIASGVTLKTLSPTLTPFGANAAVPQLINNTFPDWFAGFAFAAIAIGALVPVAVMSIAAANLFTKNIYKEYIKPNSSEREESQVAKIASFVVKFGALLFIIYLPTQQVINFQLLGGIWIIQTLPAVFLGLYTRWFNRWALLIGWLVGMVGGTLMGFSGIITGTNPNITSVYALPIAGLNVPLYAAITSLIVNLVLAIVLTPVFEAVGARRGRDMTVPTDYNEDLAPAEPVEVVPEALG